LVKIGEAGLDKTSCQKAKQEKTRKGKESKEMGIFSKKRNGVRTSRVIRKSVLQDVEVDLISLLFDEVTPANGKGYVVKMKDGKDVKFELRGSSLKFKAAEGDKGLVYVTIMEPGVVDAHGDSYSEETVRKAMEQAAGRNIFRAFDKNHDMRVIDEVVMVESLQLNKADERWPDAKEGSWVGVLKFNKESESWTKVKAGKFNGVSIFGRAKDSGEAERTAVKAVIDELKGLAEGLKAAGEDKAAAQVQAKIAEHEQAEGGGDEVMKAMREILTELSESIKKAVSPTIKEEGQEMKAVRKSMVGIEVNFDPRKKELYKSFASLDSGKSLSLFTDSLGKQFIDQTLQDPDDDTLSDLTVAPLTRRGKIDKGLIEDVILYNTDDDAREMLDHSHSDLAFDPQELDADVSLKESTAEDYRDAMGVQEFGAYMNAKVVGGVKQAVRRIIFKGDRTGLAAIKAIDGFFKKAESNGDIQTIDGKGVLGKIDNAMLSFGEETLQYKDKFVIYLTAGDREALMQMRNVDVSDQGRLVRDKDKLYLDGVQVKSRPLPSGGMIIGMPKFLVVGYINDAKLKLEHSGSDHRYHWYPRITVDVNYVRGGYVKFFRFVSNQPPVASNVAIIEDGLNTGDTLEGFYEYHDSYGDAEGSSTFRWLAAATAAGSYSAISGATSRTYALVAANATKYIKFEVTPKDANGVAGTAVLSAAVGPCTNV
jgi:hypothetical protein